MFVALILVWGFENLPTNTCFYDVNKPVAAYKNLPK
jgi:hypothetical protein